MTLHCKVIAIEHASNFTDEKERITVRVAEADSLWNTLRITQPSLPLLALGYEFTLKIVDVKEAT